MKKSQSGEARNYTTIARGQDFGLYWVCGSFATSDGTGERYVVSGSASVSEEAFWDREGPYPPGVVVRERPGPYMGGDEEEYVGAGLAMPHICMAVRSTPPNYIYAGRVLKGWLYRCTFCDAADTVQLDYDIDTSGPEGVEIPEKYLHTGTYWLQLRSVEEPRSLGRYAQAHAHWALWRFEEALRELGVPLGNSAGEYLTERGYGVETVPGVPGLWLRADEAEDFAANGAELGAPAEMISIVAGGLELAAAVRRGQRVVNAKVPGWGPQAIAEFLFPVGAPPPGEPRR